MTLTVGPLATALIHHFENCSLTAYRDVKGVPTIGWGMTYYPDGRRVQMGDIISQRQADEMGATILERDFADPVRTALGSAPTTPAQYGAMVALAYNIGMGPRLWVPPMTKGFRQSDVLKLHLKGDYVGAADSFDGWIKSGGAVRPGLVRRRDAEAALYRSDWAGLKRFTQGQVAA